MGGLNWQSAKSVNEILKTIANVDSKMAAQLFENSFFGVDLKQCVTTWKVPPPEFGWWRLL